MRKVIVALIISILIVQTWSTNAMAAVTDSEIEELLQQYDMTRDELNVVLEEFGSSVEEFDTQEELADALDFYLNHLSEMKDLEEFLITIGLTEEETDRIFAHFDQLDQELVQQSMVELSTRLDELLMLDQESGLTNNQIQELEAIFAEMMQTLQLQANYYLINSDGERVSIPLSTLITQPFNSERLYVELLTTNGDVLADIELSEEMIDPDFFVSSLEKMNDMGELVAELPNTATNYALGMIAGILLMVSSLSLWLIRKRMYYLWKKA